MIRAVEAVLLFNAAESRYIQQRSILLAFFLACEDWLDVAFQVQMTLAVWLWANHGVDLVLEIGPEGHSSLKAGCHTC